MIELGVRVDAARGCLEKKMQWGENFLPTPPLNPAAAGREFPSRMFFVRVGSEARVPEALQIKLAENIRKTPSAAHENSGKSLDLFSCLI